jgi:hypothetical protein
MGLTSERREYRAALADKDWAKAAQLVRDNPDIFGTPPPGVSDEIACLVNDPLEPGWMVVEWSVQKNKCKGQPHCKSYTKIANQFDHLPLTATKEEVEAWFQNYINNRVEHAPAKDQIGQTLYLLKVEEVVQITGFDGGLVNG